MANENNIFGNDITPFHDRAQDQILVNQNKDDQEPAYAAEAEQFETTKIRSKTTEGRLWIVPEREIEKRIEIQFVPASIDWSRSSNIQTIVIVGRNNPLYQYTSGETVLPLKLDFYAQQEDRKDVITTCKFLESLSANNGYKKPPQRIRIIWGDLFKDEMWVIKSVKYKLDNFDKEFGFLPKQAYVDLDLVLDTKGNLTSDDIRRF
jgi:hypothetical protein